MSFLKNDKNQEGKASLLMASTAHNNLLSKAILWDPGHL